VDVGFLKRWKNGRAERMHVPTCPRRDRNFAG
jgi:hypothetical protein